MRAAHLLFLALNVLWRHAYVAALALRLGVADMAFSFDSPVTGEPAEALFDLAGDWRTSTPIPSLHRYLLDSGVTDSFGAARARRYNVPVRARDAGCCTRRPTASPRGNLLPFDGVVHSMRSPSTQLVAAAASRRPCQDGNDCDERCEESDHDDP